MGLTWLGHRCLVSYGVPPILSAKVVLVFLVYAYLEVICVRDTVITPDHEVHVVHNYSPSHIELHI